MSNIPEDSIGTGAMHAKYLEPWVIDASAYTGEISLDKLQIFGPDTITNFVGAPHANALLIISGSKGSGKTLALRKRSFSYRNTTALSGIKCIPENVLVEKLQTLLTQSFDQEKLASYRTEENWFIIWEIAIAAAIMNRLGHPLPSELAVLLKGGRGGIGEFVARLVETDKGAMEHARHIVNDEVRPFLREVRDPVAVFLDSIEEAMERHAGYYLEQYLVHGNRRYGHLNEEVWRNSQVALIDAAIEIRSLNSHIKVFAAVRSEAVDRYPGGRSANVHQWVTKVTYDKDDLERIFNHNVFLTEVMQEHTGKVLVKVAGATPIQKFFGTESDSFEHWAVKRQERIFDALWRHTLGRPRDIIELGRALNQLPLKHRTDREKVADVVNTASGLIFDNFKKEVYPFWETRFDPVLSLITRNVLTHRHLQGIRKEFFDRTQVTDDPFEYLYRKGLLGVSRSSGQDEILQFFLNCSEDNEHKLLPQSGYFFVHPCLANEIRRDAANDGGRSFISDKRVIVGQGCPIPKNFCVARIVLSVDRQFLTPIVYVDDRPISEINNFDHVVTVLLFALFMAFHHRKASKVTVDEVVEQVGVLVTKKLAPPTLGKKQIPAEDYIKDQFAVSDSKKNDAIRDVRAMFSAHGYRNEQPIFSQTGQYVTLNEFSISELDVSLD